MSLLPAKTQISLGIRPVWSESSLSAWRNLGSLATHWAHSEDWSVWADAQVDLSLRWAHTHFVGFVMLWLTLCPKDAGRMANSVDPDETAASDQDFHCFHRPLCPNI